MACPAGQPRAPSVPAARPARPPSPSPGHPPVVDLSPHVPWLESQGAAFTARLVSPPGGDAASTSFPHPVTSLVSGSPRPRPSLRSCQPVVSFQGTNRNGPHPRPRALPHPGPPPDHPALAPCTHLPAQRLPPAGSGHRPWRRVQTPWAAAVRGVRPGPAPAAPTCPPAPWEGAQTLSYAGARGGPVVHTAGQGNPDFLLLW